MIESLPFDIARIHQAYDKGLLPRDIVSECQRRIEEADDEGIFIYKLSQEELNEQISNLAEFNPVKFPLWGIPFVVKDNIDVKSLETTAACPEYAYTAEQDAFVVSLLREAGAILIGKTNLDQFATGLVGVRSPYPIPKNAINESIIPGGSSSGSATAVSRGIVSFSLGTDTAGSGRVPAALNNIVGLKPSLRCVSVRGVVPACYTLDVVSIFSLHVQDAVTVFNILSTYDDQEPSSEAIAQQLFNDNKDCVIAIPDSSSIEFFDDTIQSDCFSQALNDFKSLGSKILSIDFKPFYQVASLLYEGSWVAERYSVIESLLNEKPDAVLDVTATVINGAKKFSAVDTFRDFYKLQALKHQIQPLFDAFDIICVPSTPTIYSLDEVEKEPFLTNSRLGTYTNFVNLLNLCAITVPVKQRSDQLPGSITLIAPAGNDLKLAHFANKIQQLYQIPLGATRWQLPEKKPETTAVTASNEEIEIEIAVVGAHMQGLPLNYELVNRGARFIKQEKTSPQYRLFSLPGGPPYRPGMLKDDVNGASILLEVWALPKNKFGDFIEGVPAPLTIGTIQLSDSSYVKSFLCESWAVDDAEEITHLGGWRAFINLSD